MKDSLQVGYMYGLTPKGKFNQNAFMDIDEALSKTYIIENMNKPEVSSYFKLATEKRPEEELYDIINDPYCLKNLASDAGLDSVKSILRQKLNHFLVQTGDPRLTGENPDIFETYPRFSPIRLFPKGEWTRNEPASFEQ